MAQSLTFDTDNANRTTEAILNFYRIQQAIAFHVNIKKNYITSMLHNCLIICLLNV